MTIRMSDNKKRITFPVHMWHIDDNGLMVIRLKQPRFKSYYKDGKFQQPIFDNPEETPADKEIIKLMKKAEAFMKHEYFAK